jgi:hypothetical protein
MNSALNATTAAVRLNATAPDMEHPSYVVHDDKRWYVVRSTRVDGARAYVLRNPSGRTILARAAECQEWRRSAESLRVFRAGEHVLEIRASAGQVRGIAVRRARSSRRYDTSIPAIYSMTVKASIAITKTARRLARRK